MAIASAAGKYVLLSGTGLTGSVAASGTGWIMNDGSWSWWGHSLSEEGFDYFKSDFDTQNIDYASHDIKFTFEFTQGDCFSRFFPGASFPSNSHITSDPDKRSGFLENPTKENFLKDFVLSGDLIGCQVSKLSEHNKRFVYKSETVLKGEKRGWVLSSGATNLKFKQGLIDTEFWLLRLEKYGERWVTTNWSYWMSVITLKKAGHDVKKPFVYMNLTTTPNGRK